MGLASKFTVWLIGLLCLAAVTPALAAEGQDQCAGRGLPNVGTVYFPEPIPPDPARRRPYREEIVISDDGGLALNGRAIDFAFLRSDLAAALEDGRSEMAIRPSANVRFSSVVPVLGLLNELKHCQSYFVGNEMHSEVFSENRLTIDHVSPPPPSFSIFKDAMVSIVFVPGSQDLEHSTALGRCHAFFTSREVSSAGMRELAYERLFHIVGRNGGLANTPRNEMNAIIQAKASTPWRCIAGAIYNVQVAGYRNADLVVLPDDQPVPADPPPPTPTVTAVDLFEVGYGPSDGETQSRCHIYFDRRQVAFGDRIVEVFAGGNVAVHSDVSPQLPDIEAAQSGIAAPTAAVRARQDTPWRCVAGAIYGIQTAGYANVGFISSPED